MKIISIVVNWWSDINLKTRLIVLTTLTVSLIMSGLTFSALTIIQQKSIITDNRFCQDLGILFASNLLELISNNNQKELASFIEKIYLSTSSIRYIFLFRVDGTLFFSLPVYSDKVQSLLQLNRNLFQLEMQNFLFGIPIVKLNTAFNESITDIIIPLTKNGQALGSVNIGINSNIIFASSSKLIRDMSIAVFVSIWLMFLIGAAFNSFILKEPINDLLFCLRNIAGGNFSSRITSPFQGELSELIVSFNEMAEKLECYEKKNIEKLIIEKTKLETIISTITDGAILLDAELRFVFVNQAAIKFFRWSNIDIIGKFICDHFPLHVNTALLPVLNKLVALGNLYTLDYKTEELCVNFDYDSPKIFRFLLTTILDINSKSLIGVAIIIQDVSREVKLNDAKNHFITNVSHELRTPLCNIGSFLETLLDYHDTLTDKQQRNFLAIANSEAKRLSILVDNILNLSQLESEQNYHLDQIDLMGIINDIIQSNQLVASYNDIQLIREFDKDIKLVWGNESSLMQVFANLLSNAIKFTSVHGQIVLRIYKVHQFSTTIDSNTVDVSIGIPSLIRIEIIDEGIGIDPRDQKQVFDRFVRIENHAHILEGTGLGLSIVKNILIRHNTKVFLKSESYVGTSLWFDLWQAN